MTKAPRKSIVASFGILSAELENKLSESAPSPAPPGGGRVGAGVIGAAHRAIDDIRSERDRLKAIVESGGGAVRELDPSVIDPSPYPDRLPDDDEASFQAFKRSIAEEGQKVPIQVRKHPTSSGRYQIIYGHRRWLASKQLGKPVRALEVEISDLDLVLAQGIENASRQDLTWIERALFASRMDDAGIKPRHIYAALAIEDAELARMRSVYRVIPSDVIEAIGRAPKVGRPRWLALAKALANAPASVETVRKALSAKSDRVETSDQRFQRVLQVLQPVVKKAADATILADSSGTALGVVTMLPNEVRVAAEGAVGQDFLKFVEAELPQLAQRFARQRQHKET